MATRKSRRPPRGDQSARNFVREAQKAIRAERRARAALAAATIALRTAVEALTRT